MHKNVETRISCNLQLNNILSTSFHCVKCLKNIGPESYVYIKLVTKEKLSFNLGYRRHIIHTRGIPWYIDFSANFYKNESRSLSRWQISKQPKWCTTTRNTALRYSTL